MSRRAKTSMGVGNVIFALLAFALAGCLYITEYDACFSDDDCASGERCRQGACRDGASDTSTGGASGEGGAMGAGGAIGAGGGLGVGGSTQGSSRCVDVPCHPDRTVQIEPAEVDLFLAENGEGRDRLSDRAVAMCDGYAVVGAPLADRGGERNAGKAYVLSLSGGDAQEIWATSAVHEMRFGDAVACMGDMILVGAPGKPGEETPGEVYVFTRQPGGRFAAASTPVVSRPASAAAHFGCAIALSGSYGIIGAYGENDEEGGAYIYQVNRQDHPETWERPRMESVRLASGDRFGFAVDIIDTDGTDFAMVGAPRRDLAGVENAGQVFFFSRGNDRWSRAGEYALSGPDRRAEYGHSVAMRPGGFAAAGAPGANRVRAYYLEGRVLSDQDLYEEGADGFGDSLDFDGDTLWVGAPNADGGRGAVHSYGWNHHTNQWQSRTVIHPKERADDGLFGRGLNLLDGRAIVGSPGYDGEGENERGAAYIFDVDGLECRADGTCVCRDEAQPCQ